MGIFLPVSMGQRQLQFIIGLITYILLLCSYAALYTNYI